MPDSDSWRSAEAYRQERDRFMAFAFAAGDLLLELDANFHIRFATGAAETLATQGLGGLGGRSFFDLIAREDRALARALVVSIGLGGRILPTTIRLAGADRRPMILGGCRLPLDREVYHVTLSRPGAGVASAVDAAELDPESGALTKDAFTRLAASPAPDAGPRHVTLLELTGLAALQAGLDAELAAGLIAGIGRMLQSDRSPGEAAGRLGDGRFGVVHTSEIDLKALMRRITGFAKAIDPNGAGLGAAGVTIDHAPDLGEEEAARVLLYSINRFAESGAAFSAHALSGGIAAFVRHAASEMNRLRTDLTSQRFELAFQPIVKLTSRKPHHYEALLRFAPDASPAERILFAEQAGLIGELDLAVLSRAIDIAEARREAGAPTTIAVNLSAGSLQRPGFRAEMDRRLVPALASFIMLEITESATAGRTDDVAGFLHALRERKFRICLDDFGAGAAGLDHLGAFAVDFVKIDGQYVRGVTNGGRERAMIASVAALAGKLGVTVIAEQVETDAEYAALKALGIELGQGYLFGKPGGLPVPARVSKPGRKRRA